MRRNKGQQDDEGRRARSKKHNQTEGQEGTTSKKTKEARNKEQRQVPERKADSDARRSKNLTKQLN